VKKITLASILLALSAFASIAYADIPLESKDQIDGTWKLQYTKLSVTAKESIPREDTWVFKDGKIAILNIPREGDHYDQKPQNFELEDGKIKVPYIGRSGFDTFALVEKTADTMVMKGRFGEYYYFKKK